MPLRLTSIVVEATDVVGLAGFWHDWNTQWLSRSANGEVRLVPAEWDAGLEVMFVPTSGRPKTGKNRIHLDVPTQTLSDYRFNRVEFARLGARPADVGQGDLVPWTVLADPEGNEFCLLKPRDGYTDTGAFAAIVVDCADPRRLATFWSGATGWQTVSSEAGFAALRAPGDRGPFLEFLRVDEPNPEPSRVSLAFESYWPHQHQSDLVGLWKLGARVIRRELGHTLLADPEGNEFRVAIPVWPPPGP